MDYLIAILAALAVIDGFSIIILQQQVKRLRKDIREHYHPPREAEMGYTRFPPP